MRTLRIMVVLSVLTAAAPVSADSHYVTVVNASSVTMTIIQFSPAGTPPGPNRLQSILPPSAAGKIAYSTGCLIDIRVGFADGSFDQRANVDACADPRVPLGSLASATAPAISALAGSVKAPEARPEATRWDGRAITKHLGMDGWVDN